MRKLMVLAVSVALVAWISVHASEARADRTVRANEPVVWFDDIRKTTKEVRFAEDERLSPEGDDGTDGINSSGNNRSGLGDGTNPGQGSGSSNSPNQGTNNPNNKPK